MLATDRYFSQFGFEINVFREIIMFLVDDVVFLIYFRESNGYFLYSRIFIREKCIDWLMFFQIGLKNLYSGQRLCLRYSAFKSAMAAQRIRLELRSWIQNRANLIFKLFIYSDFYKTISTMWVKFKYESRRRRWFLVKQVLQMASLDKKCVQWLWKMWRIFKVPFVSGQPSFWKRKKKDIHEDILDDDIDIKVESKKFDEKISPRCRHLCWSFTTSNFKEWQIWP